MGLSSLHKGRPTPLTAVLSYVILVIKKAERTQFAGRKPMTTYKEKKVRVKVVQHRNKMPSEAVKSLSLEISELGWKSLTLK